MGAPLEGIKIAVKGPAAKKMRHVIRGRVHGVHTSHNGKYVHLEVRHGRKKAAPKAKKGEPQAMPYAYDDRPTSTISMPTELAKDYGVGSHIHIGIAPADNPAANLMGDEDEDDEEHEVEDDE